MIVETMTDLELLDEVRKDYEVRSTNNYVYI